MTKSSQDTRLARLTSEDFRDVIGRFASGVTVITTSVDGSPAGTTASAVTSLSLDPPMLLICMNKASSTGRAIAASGAFAVNILGEDDHDLAKHFAGKGDKFASPDVEWTTGDHGQPLLVDALAQIVCEVDQCVEAATHVIFIARAHEATARPGAPLAYYRGRFGRLAFDDDPDA